MYYHYLTKATPEKKQNFQKTSKSSNQPDDLTKNPIKKEHFKGVLKKKQNYRRASKTWTNHARTSKLIWGGQSAAFKYSVTYSFIVRQKLQSAESHSNVRSHRACSCWAAQFDTLLSVQYFDFIASVTMEYYSYSSYYSFIKLSQSSVSASICMGFGECGTRDLTTPPTKLFTIVMPMPLNET